MSADFFSDAPASLYDDFAAGMQDAWELISRYDQLPFGPDTALMLVYAGLAEASLPLTAESQREMVAAFNCANGRVKQAQSTASSQEGRLFNEVLTRRQRMAEMVMGYRKHTDRALVRLWWEHSVKAVSDS